MWGTFSSWIGCCLFPGVGGLPIAGFCAIKSTFSFFFFFWILWIFGSERSEVLGRDALGLGGSFFSFFFSGPVGGLRRGGYIHTASLICCCRFDYAWRLRRFSGSLAVTLGQFPMDIFCYVIVLGGFDLALPSQWLDFFTGYIFCSALN